MVHVSGLAPLAVICGLTLGLGLWLLVSLAPRLGTPSLAARVAPYVIDVSKDARELLDHRTADPLPVFGAIFGPILGRVRRLLGYVPGGSDRIARRLRQAGSATSVDGFRSQQLIWALGGVGVGVVAAIAIAAVQPIPFVAEAALVVLTCVAGLVVRDYLLQRTAASRIRRMSAELPTVLEFMTLSLSAGEGILDAIRRVSRISRGELAVELGTVVADVNTGLPLADSLNKLAAALQLLPLTRAIDQITGALERGTPLAEVLRAQAQDARDDAKRELIEVSGRKEIAMLVPLVFLILPTTIAIAVFPGVYVLQLGF